MKDLTKHLKERCIMKKKEVVEGNKIIAEFVGKDDVCDHSYDKSLDDLLPVIQSIGKICKKEPSVFEKAGCYIDTSLLLDSFKVIDAFIMCVEWIKWYINFSNTSRERSIGKFYI